MIAVIRSTDIVMSNVVTVASIIFGLALCVIPCCRNYMDHKGISARLQDVYEYTDINESSFGDKNWGSSNSFLKKKSRNGSVKLLG